MAHFHIVLVEPEIPQNTGNIARTCSVTGASLHLVHPLGFTITDAKLKRAGLDYWGELDLHHHQSLADFMEYAKGKELFFFSTKGLHTHSDAVYPDEAFLVFGKETAGLPEELLRQHPEHTVRIPMRESMRSLNLSNSVAVAVYEAVRQHGFEGLGETPQTKIF